MWPASASLPLPVGIGGKIVKGLFGDAGETELVYGNTNEFTYYGQKLEVERSSNHPIEIKPPKLYTQAQQDAVNTITNAISAPPTAGSPEALQLEAAEKLVNTETIANINNIVYAGYDPLTLVMVPPPIKVCLGVGILAIFSTTMILRFYNGVDSVYDSSSTTPQTQLVLAIASDLISQLECSWLYLLTLLEMETLGTALVYNTIVIKAQGELSEAEAKVASIQADIAKNTNLVQLGGYITAPLAAAALAKQQAELVTLEADVVTKKSALNLALQNFNISKLGYVKT
jgi:hypothetical protein